MRTRISAFLEMLAERIIEHVDFIKNKIIRGKTPSMFRLPFVYSLGKAMVV